MTADPIVWSVSSPPCRADIEAIAADGAEIALAPDLLERLEAGHAALRAAIGEGGSVYGVNTGQGFLAGHSLSDEDAALHQRNLLLGRAVGSAPWLTREESRALLAVRLARFVEPGAGVSAGLCRYIADRLNDGFTPAVPRSGIGCAGEVIPLAHAFQALTGVGAVLDTAGEAIDAATALTARGAAPYEPGPKEGIALLAGSPGVTALAILRVRDGAALARAHLLAAACSADAARVPVAPLSPAAGHGSRDPLLADALAHLGSLLGGPRPGAGGPQGPVSFRVAPQLAAHLARTLARLAEDADRCLGSGDDSPALADGAFVSTGTFHEIGLAAGMDALTAALARVAEASAQRTHRLLDGRVTGLPDQLTPRPGPRCGLVVLHKRAVGTVHEMRRLAVPASLGAVDTSLGQEDVQSFGFASAEALRQAIALAREVLAVELIAARQAWWLRGRPPAAGLAGAAAALEAAVAPVDEDRPLGDDVTRVARLVLDIS